LSGERLAPPVVADELGSLFNKDAVVTALVTRSLPPALGHISALRHLIDLTLARNPTYAGPASASAADFQPGNGAEWCCPVTGLELNGRYRFVVLRRGGHVVSEKALKEVLPMAPPGASRAPTLVHVAVGASACAQCFWFLEMPCLASGGALPCCDDAFVQLPADCTRKRPNVTVSAD